MLLPLPLTAEDEFWALADEAKSCRITKSMMGQLVKLTSDFKRAKSILVSSFQKKIPHLYLAKVLKNLQDEAIPPHFPVIPTITPEPEVVIHARLRGWPVRKSRRSNGEDCWWVAGIMYDTAGVDVGG